jgi:hypothetical protein
LATIYYVYDKNSGNRTGNRATSTVGWFRVFIATLMAVLVKIIYLVNRISTRNFVGMLLLVGIGERALWNLIRLIQYIGFPGAAGEALNVAVALAHGLGFADAYRAGQGPTAHLLPIAPAIAGGVYAIFGVQTLPAEFLLACWSIGLAMGTYLLLFKAFDRLGTSRWARLIGLAFACVAPVYIGQESVDFRVWEGGLAAFLCALFLERLLTLQPGKSMDMRVVAGMAALTALLFFVNPLLGLGAYACAALTCVQKLRGARLAGAIGLGACALAIILTPWVIRNYIVMGEPILLRSDLGIELAMADYSGALEASDPLDQYHHRQREIHPFNSDTAYQAMHKSGGELAYSRQLGEETWHWIAANPWTTVRLAFLHLRETFLPPAWQFRNTGSGLFPGLRAALSSLVGLLGLFGLARALYDRRPNWAYPTFLIIVPALAYCMFQPVPRYTYLFYPMLIFCAADFLGSIADKMRLKMSTRSDERVWQPLKVQLSCEPAASKPDLASLEIR